MFDGEVAHVGRPAVEAAQAGGEPMTVQLADVDRAVIDGEFRGYFDVIPVAFRAIQAGRIGVFVVREGDGQGSPRLLLGPGKQKTAGQG